MKRSTADAEKWRPLLEHLSNPGKARKPVTGSGIAANACPQRRFTEGDLAELIRRYEASESTKQLAASMGWSRHATAHQLKKAGITIGEYQSPTADQVDEIVRLYDSGLSMARVGERVGFSARSVMKYLLERGVATRDTHGRSR